MFGILVEPLTQVLRRKTPESPVAPGESYGKTNRGWEEGQYKRQEKAIKTKIKCEEGNSIRKHKI